MVTRRQIQNQQMLLKALGFYRGKCDGIWSTQTTKAKQTFEVDPSFKPAYPNRGLPFSIELNSKYPAGVYSDPVNRGMLAHASLTQELVKEWSGDLVTVHDNRKEAMYISKPEPEPEPELETVEPERNEAPTPSTFSNKNKNKHKR